LKEFLNKAKTYIRYTEKFGVVEVSKSWSGEESRWIRLCYRWKNKIQGKKNQKIYKYHPYDMT